jgi:hypothetical protein
MCGFTHLQRMFYKQDLSCCVNCLQLTEGPSGPGLTLPGHPRQFFTEPSQHQPFFSAGMLSWTSHFVKPCFFH